MEKYFKVHNYPIPPKTKCTRIVKPESYYLLYKHNFTISQIKDILKKHNISSGKYKKKCDLLHYAINMLFIYNKINKIQKCWRNHFIKQFNKTLGPSFKNKKLSNNVDDFYTAEDVDEIDYYYYFSFKDNDGFIYTFNIVSIHSLLQKRHTENPYNRSKFSSEIINSVKIRMKYNKILQKTDVFDDYKPVELTFENKISNIFSQIDELGNYSNVSWFIDLNLIQTKRFLYELFEIWTFRAQLTNARKIEICPPIGNPFHNIPTSAYMTTTHFHSLESLRKMCLTIMEKLVYRAHNDSDKNIGALYILSSLTLVSLNARNSLPWLYASVNYIN
tara:strand:- start:892 stop:1887 length:996 start_codon:yes stop_codon:yes gene_type:complete